MVNRADETVRSFSGAASEAIVREVASQAGVEPTALETPLYEVVDPDALDAVVSSLQRAGTGSLVSLTFAGYELTVTSDGVLRSRPEYPGKE